jgi:hypothetical protein
MSREQIVELLIQKRDRLERAIHALSGGEKRRGRPPKKDQAIFSGSESSAGEAPKRKRHVSAAARKRMAEGQRKRWAALKASK